MFGPHSRIDEYELLEPLGHGGQSTVYKARHRLMNRYVALKVLHPDTANDEQRRKRFRIEIEVSAMLIHPNILRAYDAREFQGIPYLVMELCQGKDLAEAIRAAGQLSPDVAVRYVRQAALGLAFAHEHGVVHRDVKPANLFLTDDKTLLVFDWGLARLRHGTPDGIDRAEDAAPAVSTQDQPNASEQSAPELESLEPEGQERKFETISRVWEQVPREMAATGTFVAPAPAPAGQVARVPADSLSWAGHIVGTPAFMAPEQAKLSEVDFRADIYSLGATLFFLLVGKPMFAGHVHEVLHAHQGNAIPPLADFRSDAPPKLDDIYHKMVAKDPAQRYQSMTDVIRAMDGLTQRSRVFISYRREDSIDATDRMYEKLSAHFGIENVFMDVDTIPPGTDFRQRLQQAVDQAAVVLVVIGDHWLTASTRSFWWRKRRLDDPNDFVRIEIEAALTRGIPVVPVLVGHQSRMPSPVELPRTLRDLAFQQAAEVRPGRQYHEQIEDLIATIREHLSTRND